MYTHTRCQIISPVSNYPNFFWPESSRSTILERGATNAHRRGLTPLGFGDILSVSMLEELCELPRWSSSHSGPGQPTRPPVITPF